MTLKQQIKDAKLLLGLHPGCRIVCKRKKKVGVPLKLKLEKTEGLKNEELQKAEKANYIIRTEKAKKNELTEKEILKIVSDTIAAEINKNKPVLTPPVKTNLQGNIPDKIINNVIDELKEDIDNFIKNEQLDPHNIIKYQSKEIEDLKNSKDIAELKLKKFKNLEAIEKNEADRLIKYLDNNIKDLNKNIELEKELNNIKMIEAEKDRLEKEKIKEEEKKLKQLMKAEEYRKEQRDLERAGITKKKEEDRKLNKDIKEITNDAIRMLEQAADKSLKEAKERQLIKEDLEDFNRNRNKEDEEEIIELNRIRDINRRRMEARMNETSSEEEKTLNEIERLANKADSLGINDFFNGSGKVGTGMTDQELDHIMRNEPYYQNCISADEINTLKPHKKMEFIINTDPKSGPGKHWCACFIDIDGDQSVEYYDPLADDPTERFKHDIQKYVIDKLDPKTLLKFKINKVIDQRSDTDTCGLMCVNFLKKRNRGVSFKNATGYIEPHINKTKQFEKEARDIRRTAGFGFI